MLRRLSVLGVCVSVIAGCGDSAGGTEGETGGTPGTSGETTVTQEPTTAGETSSGSTAGPTTTVEGTSSEGSSGETTAAPTSTGDESSTTSEPFTDIEEALGSIEGLTWEEKDSEVEGYRYFLLYYLQPADHDDPDGLKFTQHMTLLHRDGTAPTVISTDGYYIYPWYQGVAEPTALLHANQLIVEHRFFADSRPDPADWSLLTIEQAAADHHRITRALQQAIYVGPWVSTGVSKGGMTASYFRRFYPDDLAATVSYVAPLSYGTADLRYWDYLEAIDGPCNAKLVDFEREVLLRRDEMQMRIADEAAQEGLTYTLVGEDRALEEATQSVIWAFWQYGSAQDCQAIPTAAASDDAVWEFLNDHSAPHDVADARVEAFEPYYFQASFQLGCPGTDSASVMDLLQFETLPVSAYVFPGPGKDPGFVPEPMLDVQAWIEEEASEMLFIYGERDPWTGGMYNVAPDHDVHRFVAPGMNHGADIAGLTPADRAFVYERLEAWTGVTPVARPLPPELPLKVRLTLAP